MINQANLLITITQSIIQDPSDHELWRIISSERNTIFEQITAKCMKRPGGARRRDCLHKQLSVLVRLAEALYMESKFQEMFMIKRALLVVLQLIKDVNQLLNEPEPRALLPKAMLDRARKKYHCFPLHIRELCHKVDLGAELTELVLTPLNNLLNTPERNLYTYRDLFYLEGYLQGIMELKIDRCEGLEADCLLEDKLVTLNFNKIAFVDYYIGKIKARIQQKKNPVERAQILRAEKKRISNLPSGTSAGYDHQCISVRAFLLGWIAEELRHLRLVQI